MECLNTPKLKLSTSNDVENDENDYESTNINIKHKIPVYEPPCFCTSPHSSISPININKNKNNNIISNNNNQINIETLSLQEFKNLGLGLFVKSVLLNIFVVP